MSILDHFKPLQTSSQAVSNLFEQFETSPYAASNHFTRYLKSLRVTSYHLKPIIPFQPTSHASSNHFTCHFKLLCHTSSHGQPRKRFKTTASHFGLLSSSSQATCDYFTSLCEAFQTISHHYASFLTNRFNRFKQTASQATATAHSK